MTINDFLKVDSLTLSRMTDAEIRAVASGGRKIANQRIMRLKDAKMTNAPAYQALPSIVKKTGGFKTKGDRSAMINQIMQEQQFIRGRTATVRGWKEVQAASAKKAQAVIKGRARFGYNEAGQLKQLRPGEKSLLTPKQVNKYWDVFHKMQQDPKRGGAVGSAELQKAVYDTIKGNPRNGVDSLSKKVAERLDRDYEEMQEERAAAADDIRRGGGSKV